MPVDEYLRSAVAFVRSASAVDIDGERLRVWIVRVGCTAITQEGGRSVLGGAVYVIVGAEGVPHDAPLRSKLTLLNDVKGVLSLSIHRADRPPVSFEARVSALVPPEEGDERLTFSAWVAGADRFEVARALGLEP